MALTFDVGAERVLARQWDKEEVLQRQRPMTSQEKK